MQLKTNSLLQSGKYRIIRLLGQGGFGITYLAENTMLGKQVAIKEFFPKDFCGRDNTSHLTLGTQNNADTVSKLKARFIKEAQNIAKLDHPGIVHIHDIFEENNTAYYVMDYIDGENLNEIVKRNGPLPEGKAVKYVEKVGEALEYIHSRNMTHFDVKPANIVIRKKDDQPILIDFGLSKQYDAHGDATSTLMQGISQGYSPIELYNYGSVSTFSPQTDVYSLGATLLYLISGKVPPQPSTIIEDGLDLSFVKDSQLKNAIESAMQVGRGKRPESMHKFLYSLSSFEKNQENITTPHSAYQSNDDDSTRIITEPVYDSIPEPQTSVPKENDKWPAFVSLLITIAIVIAMIFMSRSCGETNHADYADSIEDGYSRDSISHEDSLNESKNINHFLNLTENEKNELFNSIPISTEKEVDLGLSVNWAGYNIGASKPEQYGNLYRYADPENKIVYDIYHGNHRNRPYDEKNFPTNIIGTKNDMATINWGEEWNTPSKAQAQELIDNCLFKDTIYNNIKGTKIIGPSKKAIFMPHAGCMYTSGRFGEDWSFDYQLGEGYMNEDGYTENEFASVYTLIIRDSPCIYYRIPEIGHPVRAVKQNELK